MKTRAITVAVILGGFSAAISQEFDDVYFSKKDREPVVVFSKKEKEQTAALAVAQTHKKLKSLDETTSILQATDPAISMEGYTGRTINPDYQPGGVMVTKASYFTPNYQPTGVNAQLNRNNSYTSNNYYPYNNFGNSFYGNGFGNGLGYSPYGYGNGFNSGFGGYSPYGSSWGCSPYYGGMNSMYSNMAFGMGYGYGSGYYGGGYYGSYPSTVVVVNNPDSHINKVYSKRESRSDYAGNSNTSTSRGTALTTTGPTQAGRGGRVATTSNSNTYYQRGWRQDPALNQPTTTSGSRSSSIFTGGTSGGSRSTWGSSGGSTRTSSWGDNNSSFSTGGTRSTTSFGSGGSTISSGSRSSSFSGGSSVGGGGSTSRPSGGGSGGSRGRN